MALAAAPAPLTRRAPGIGLALASMTTIQLGAALSSRCSTASVRPDRSRCGSRSPR
jgi:hypothetical protein